MRRTAPFMLLLLIGAIVAGCGSAAEKPAGSATAQQDKGFTVTKSANGESFSCPTDEMDDIQNARTMVDRHDGELASLDRKVKGLRRKVKRKPTPSGVSRYKAAVKAFNAAVKAANKDIDAYNSLLRSTCRKQ